MKDQILSLKKYPTQKKYIKILPKLPGVYLFFKENKLIYVGKAINLRNRVESYFLKNIGIKTLKMINQANHFSIILVESELEALLLEAHLIRKNQPKYNLISKDDKHPLYIKITREEYPRVLTARKIEENENNMSFYGPFPSTKIVYSVLKMLRKVFPFSDHKIGEKECLYSHMNLCNPCPSLIEKELDPNIKKNLRKKYLENIRAIMMILGRSINKLLISLENRMVKFAKEENYEQAAEIKKQIQSLNYITQDINPVENFLENPNLLEDIRNNELEDLKEIISTYSSIEIKKLEIIECFDVSHISGVSSTASLVCFENGEPEKTRYRRFKIKQNNKNSDIDSLKEIAERRLKRIKDWKIPDLIIVDGGKGQAKIFFEVFKKINLPVCGIAKRLETLVIPSTSNGKIVFREICLKDRLSLHLVQRLRDEAHRFALKYHHSLFKKGLLKLS